jgi:hypothetical protein
VQLQNLRETVSVLASDDIQAKEAAAIHLRKLLCVGQIFFAFS